MDYILIILRTWSTADIVQRQGIEQKLAKILRDRLQDADPVVRTKAREACKEFVSHFPGLRSALEKDLDKQQLSLLEKALCNSPIQQDDVTNDDGALAKSRHIALRRSTIVPSPPPKKPSMKKQLAHSRPNKGSKVDPQSVGSLSENEGVVSSNPSSSEVTKMMEQLR